MKKLFHRIETDMADFGAPKMNLAEVRLAEAPNDRHLLAYRCVEKCGDYLFGNPNFAGHMAFAPVVEFGPDGIRRFTNVNTGDCICACSAGTPTRDNIRRRHTDE